MKFTILLRDKNKNTLVLLMLTLSILQCIKYEIHSFIVRQNMGRLEELLFLTLSVLWRTEHIGVKWSNGIVYSQSRFFYLY